MEGRGRKNACGCWMGDAAGGFPQTLPVPYLPTLQSTDKPSAVGLQRMAPPFPCQALWRCVVLLYKQIHKEMPGQAGDSRKTAWEKPSPRCHPLAAIPPSSLNTLCACFMPSGLHGRRRIRLGQELGEEPQGGHREQGGCVTLPGLSGSWEPIGVLALAIIHPMGLGQ